jgi:hypothetical protein
MLKGYKTGLWSYMDHQCNLSASGPTTRWRVRLHKAFRLCEYVFAFCQVVFPIRLSTPVRTGSDLQLPQKTIHNLALPRQHSRR